MTVSSINYFCNCELRSIKTFYKKLFFELQNNEVAFDDDPEPAEVGDDELLLLVVNKKSIGSRKGRIFEESTSGKTVMLQAVVVL